MLPTSARLATALTTAPLHLREASVTLLPPLPLFRRLLRAHRKLPIEMRSLGDTYVKDEFRRHKTADNPIHIMGFLSQWKHYLDDVEAGQLNRGRALDMEKLEKLSNEQVAQLYELMKESKDLWKTPEEVEREADLPAGGSAAVATGSEKEGGFNNKGGDKS